VTTELDLGSIRHAPKVLLHDHLDGGLRPDTVLELAERAGYRELPADEPVALADWFRTAAHSGSLERYLQPFAHTVAVMQTAEALHRVAYECVRDLAADAVVYAEVRFAPELHLAAGLTLPQVVEAVLAGFAAGQQDAAAAGTPIVVRTLVTAMRHAARSLEIAELAIDYRDRGVCGFDIAGAEAGTRRAATSTPSSTSEVQRALHHPRRRGVRAAVDPRGAGVLRRRPARARGADRRRHHRGRRRHRQRLGRLAALVRDNRVPLELCPSSNVQTGAVPSFAEHPFDLLARLRFRVTVNTDNRLMSDTSMSREMLRLVETFGYGWADLQRFTINAMKSAFYPFDQRLALIDDVIKPRYAVLIGG
jgi:adenosine deaminase